MKGKTLRKWAGLALLLALSCLLIACDSTTEAPESTAAETAANARFACALSPLKKSLQ